MRLAATALALAIASFTAAAIGQIPFFEDGFEDHAPGSLCPNGCSSGAGSGGWMAWDNNPSVAGVVSTLRARTGTRSLRASNGTDAIQPFVLQNAIGYPQSGRWRILVHQWIDGATFQPSSGGQFVIVNTAYNHYGPYQWAVQLMCNPATGTVVDLNRPSNPVPVVLDVFVPIEIEIDLGLNTVSTRYGGQPVSTGPYTGLGSSTTNGPPVIANLDLYATSGSSVAYYDDVAVHRIAAPGLRMYHDLSGPYLGLDLRIDRGAPYASFLMFGAFRLPTGSIGPVEILSGQLDASGGWSLHLPLYPGMEIPQLWLGVIEFGGSPPAAPVVPEIVSSAPAPRSRCARTARSGSVRR